MSNEARTQTEDAYLALQSTSEFQALRKKFRGFVFPMTALFLVWYLLYALMSTYAHEFMSIRVGGNFTVGRKGSGHIDYERVSGKVSVPSRD